MSKKPPSYGAALLIGMFLVVGAAVVFAVSMKNSAGSRILEKELREINIDSFQKYLDTEMNLLDKQSRTLK